jgi:hypothetical protein
VNRTLAVLLLLIALIVGAVAFLNEGAGSLDPTDHLGFESESGERAYAEADQVAQVGEGPGPSEPLSEADRIQVDSDQESGENSVLAQPEVYAHLKIRLFGENDLPLADAAAGILKMPEPGNDFEGLQALFLTMQGQKPKGFPVNEKATDSQGYAVLPLPTSRDGWAVYGRVEGRMIAFQVIPEMQIDPGSEFDAGFLILKLGGRLEVDVVDETGASVADASVVLVTDSEDDPMEMPILFLRTDEQGQAIFSNLSFREYKIEVAKHGFLPFRQASIAITERGQAYLKALIPHGGEISGLVIGPDDRPLPGVPISLKAKDPELNPEGLTQAMLSDSNWAISDAEGGFSGSGLSAETQYTLTAELAPGVHAQSDEHQIGDFVTLKMPHTVRLTGVVVQPDGLPADHAQVGIWETSLKNRRDVGSYQTTSDAFGKFELQAEVGKFLLLVHHSSGFYMTRSPLNLAEDQDLGQLRLTQGGDLEITVIRADGSPVERVFLVRSNTNEKIPWRGRRNLAIQGMKQLRGSTIRYGAGKFSLSGLPKGEFEFQLYAPEYLDTVRRVKIIPGQKIQIQIELVQGATLNLQLLNSEGAAFSGGRQKFRLVGPPTELKPETPTVHSFRPNATGERRFDRLMPGSWVLELSTKTGEWNAIDRYQLQVGVQNLTTVVDSEAN